MTYAAAYQLVHAKYLEESKGNPAGPRAAAYKQAWQEYPALMAIAHYAVARPD
jgi:hypothetical protein